MGNTVSKCDLAHFLVQKKQCGHDETTLFYLLQRLGAYHSPEKCAATLAAHVERHLARARARARSLARITSCAKLFS